ncbi:hypothetical protein ACFFF5_20540 [Lederbergia wuyishanensis]|uniref:Uncharacterized protein n=1 Tax=Lederbergia wuyishanensis TaxID=1347903 RepID=A0ABU0D8F2_9BACI|nr:hypothetical protein [Lederbergia wuyishanensis]MCJ8009172.1 hypothetical protein [Lederbergia wuyishanensis]MDQ0344699.1 hypothetical protein [Lederbergia wuyishanensis]
MEHQLFSHKQLAASCFNKVWDYLDKEVLSPEEKEEMIHLCHSSFWHWTQVEDHTRQNISIGYWQLSRVYAVVGQGESALFYAKRCITVGTSANLNPFYIGYGYEAAARAFSTLKQFEQCKEMMKQAHDYVEKIVDNENKQLLLNDLNSIPYSV